MPFSFLFFHSITPFRMKAMLWTNTLFEDQSHIGSSITWGERLFLDFLPVSFWKFKKGCWIMHEISGSEIPKVKVAELKYLRSSFTFHMNYKEIGFIRLSLKRLSPHWHFLTGITRCYFVSLFCRQVCFHLTNGLLSCLNANERLTFFLSPPPLRLFCVCPTRRKLHYGLLLLQCVTFQYLMTPRMSW